MKTIVFPTSSCRRMTSFCMSRRISGSSAENGSSNIRSVGVGGQRPGQAHALLHAAGELVGEVVLVAREPDQVDHLLRPVAALRPRLAADLEAEARRCRSPCGGAADRSAGTPSTPCGAGRAGDSLSDIAVMSSPYELDRAGRRLDQPGDQADQGRLAGPGQAHHHEHLARARRRRRRHGHPRRGRSSPGGPCARGRRRACR